MDAHALVKEIRTIPGLKKCSEKRWKRVRKLRLERLQRLGACWFPHPNEPLGATGQGLPEVVEEA